MEGILRTLGHGYIANRLREKFKYHAQVLSDSYKYGSIIMGLND